MSKHTKTNFYGSQMTFLVQKDCVDIIFKIKKKVYSSRFRSFSLSEDRWLLACAWNGYYNRLQGMRNHKDVLARLGKVCPLAAKIFTNIVSYHFVYINKEPWYLK